MERKKILVIQTAFPGDAILTLPMIQKLKEKEKDAVIDVLCIPGTKEIFANSPYVNNSIVYDKRGEHKSIIKLFSLAARLRKRGYLKIYSPHRSLRTSILVFLSRVKETYGFDIAAFSFLYKHLIKYETGIHEVARNLSLISHDISGAGWKVFPVIETPDHVKEKAKIFLNKIAGKKYAAVAPGSVWATKVYPKKYFIEIIADLVDNAFEVILLGGKDDSGLCSEIESNFINSVHSAAGEFSIIESIELLRSCDILVSNDSAPTHMGMCADIPILTIYCSTTPNFGFYPYNGKSRWISKDDLDCKPCGIHGHRECPVGTFDCAYQLTPGEILNSISEMTS